MSARSKTLLESLEPRRLFTAIIDPSTHTLMLAGNGGAFADQFKVEIVDGGENYRVEINGVGSTFAVRAVDAISVNCGDGDDTIIVNHLQAPITVFAGQGNDTLDLANAGADVAALAGAIGFDGGFGNSDHVILRDNGTFAEDTYSFTSDGVTRTNWSGSLVYDFVDVLEVIGQGGNNTFNVVSVREGVQVELNGGQGSDTVVAGDPNGGINQISGTFHFNGGDGYDTLVLNDRSAFDFHDTYTVNETFIDRTGGNYGLISYDSPEKVVLNAQHGDNVVNVMTADDSTEFELNGGKGDDTLTLGVVTRNLNSIRGRVDFNGQDGHNTVLLDDSASTLGRNFSITLQGITASAQTSTFGGFGYQNAAVVTFNLGSGGDTVLLAHTKTNTSFVLNTGAGDDFVTVGDGFLDLLPGPVHLDTGDGTDDLTLDDEGDDFAFNDNYVVTDNAVTRQFFGGLNYAGVEWARLFASRGNNLVRLDRTSVFTIWSLVGGEGNDHFVVGGQDKMMDNIDGTCSLHGGTGNNTALFDDSLATASANWQVWDGIITRESSTGEPMNVISYEGLTTLTIETGRAADVVTVTETSLGTSTQIRSGGGGGLAADAGDTLHVDGSNDFVTLLPTFGAAPNVTVNRDFDGGAFVRIAENQQLAGLSISEGGQLRLEAGGNVTLRTSQLSITGNGVLDLADNDMILDYAGAASPIGTAAAGVYDGVTGLIQRGHNGGDWNGAGILTSMPDAAGGLTTLAVAEAADVLGIAGAETGEFNGLTVDGTTLLIKYTYAGDANLDGAITGDDYSVIDFNAGVPGAFGYFNGDFNYDGIITGDDYSVIDFNIEAQGDAL